jgi:hypothetical protein
MFVGFLVLKCIEISVVTGFLNMAPSALPSFLIISNSRKLYGI